MARNGDQTLWDQWCQRIERQRESGLSIAEFCRRGDVSQASFHVWKRKLRQSRSCLERRTTYFLYMRHLLDGRSSSWTTGFHQPQFLGLKGN